MSSVPILGGDRVLHDHVRAIVRAAMQKVKEAVTDLAGFEIVLQKASGGPGRAIDYAVERMYIEWLSATIPDVRIYSEESGMIGAMDDYQYTAFIDPVDGTELAMHDVPLYSTSMSLMDRERRLVLSVVGDVANDRIYWADGQNAYSDGRRLLVKGNGKVLSDACIANYSMTPDRMSWGKRVRDTMLKVTVHAPGRSDGADSRAK